MATPNRFFLKWFSNNNTLKASLAHRVGTRTLKSGSTATSPALYLMISLFSLRFRTNTHLYPTGFTPLGVWTTGQKTSRFINKFNYAYIASFHFGQSFLFQHSSTFCGSRLSSFLMMSLAIWKAKILLIINLF